MGNNLRQLAENKANAKKALKRYVSYVDTGLHRLAEMVQKLMIDLWSL